VYSSNTPFFNKKQNPLVRFIFLLLTSIILMLIDSRFNYLTLIRKSVSMIIMPIGQSLTIIPNTINYFNSYSTNYINLVSENKSLKAQLTTISMNNNEVQNLTQQNTQLREILELKKITKVPILASEILYNSNNPFVHKIIINSGEKQGLLIGQPVINEYGVIGQITKTYLEYSEVTLITEKQILVPIQILRNGIRGISYGSNNQGNLDIHFIQNNNDVKIGDTLITSGLDTIYPTGLAVGRITKISKSSQDGFLQIKAKPTANITNHHILVILSKPMDFNK
jgi:rod shape-determining protein MreC